MNYHASDGKHSGASNSTILISIICSILSIAASFGIYFGWKLYVKSEKKQYPEMGKEKPLKQETGNFFKFGKGKSSTREKELSRIKQQAFLTHLEENILKSKNNPEYAVEKAFLQYKNYFSTQENLADVSFQDIFSRYFPMDLPPARESEEEIRRYILKDLLPKRFPLSKGRYKFMKFQEAEKIYPLAKLGDRVKVQSLKEDNYTGIFNGFGSKKMSIQIDHKFFALYDLTIESKALFNPVINELIRKEYVIRECKAYDEEIEKFIVSALSQEMRKQGYFQRVDFFSPSEYLAFLESGRPFKEPKSKKNKQVVMPKSEEIVMKKLPPHSSKYFTQPYYYNPGPKRKRVRTMR